MASIKDWIAEMTLEEKCGLLSGKNFWQTKPVERLGIPSVMMTDGPHGLRKQAEDADHLGLNASVPAVCFPPASTTACSFDRTALYALGDALGQECRAQEVAVVLGPGTNIKRSPLCGRNFEYFSEDPLLAGELSAAYIQGVQQNNVGTSLKHFALNNQETRRMSVNAQVEDRALWEIYLSPFERAVKQGKPWTVMCSYNRWQDIYCSEHRELLWDILREQWGYQGMTVTDWGACNDHVAGVLAGLNLEMPNSGPDNDLLLIEAVRDGRVPEAVVDEAAARVLEIVARQMENLATPAVSIPAEAHHALAREIAAESMVLLKNDGGLLPLSKDARVAFLGEFARKPRNQGAGSSLVNCIRETNAVDAATGLPGVRYAQGYALKKGANEAALLADAVALAKDSDVAVLFVGLPVGIESEGYDRTHLRLPDNHLALIKAVCKVQPKTVLVLHNGSPVEMPFAGDVPAILEAYLGGEAAGEAVVDVLFGDVSPSGKLAETFPLRLEDTPSYLSFPGDGDQVSYQEGIFVGYRYYDARQLEVLYPFGHGLTYTTFSYGNAWLSGDVLRPGGSLTVSVDITNTGSRPGKEAVQLYVAPLSPGISRPPQELKGFEKVSLRPGETRTVTFAVTPDMLSYYEPRIKGWHMENGAYELRISASSRDIRARLRLQAEGSPLLPLTIHRNTCIADLAPYPKAMAILQEQLGSLVASLAGGGDADSPNAEMMQVMMQYLPLRSIRSFVSGLSFERLDALIAEMQKAIDG